MRLALLFIFALLVPVFGAESANQSADAPRETATPCAGTFSDVHSGDFFYAPVLYLACQGVVSGYSDGTFQPYNNTTRAQLAKIVVLAEAFPSDTTGGPHFADVPANNPFYSYIETAYNRSIIAGYADHSFKPFNDITRAQLSKIVVSARGWKIFRPGYADFTDVPLDHPFYDAIETAYHRGIINGYSDYSFRPGANATRGQIAKIVYLAVAGPATTVTPRATATTTATYTAAPTNTAVPTATATVTPRPTSGNCVNAGAGYQAWASVSDPAPAQNSTVTIFGLLCLNGQAGPFATMQAVWYFSTAREECSSTDDKLGHAQCARDIGPATPGYTVQIAVRFYDRNGVLLVSTATSFTPQ